MSRVIKIAAVIAVTLTGSALWAQPAAANTKVTTVFQLDDTFVDSQTCGFDITGHFLGPVKVADYYDNSGVRYKSIVTVGAGAPLRFTLTAKGITLTMQNQAFMQVFTWNADGSVNTVTNNGPIFKFTVPGSGVVLLETGKIAFDGDGNVGLRGGTTFFGPGVLRRVRIASTLPDGRSRPRPPVSSRNA
jgi:hypothetical protein